MADLTLTDGMRLLMIGDSIFDQKKWTHYLAAFLHGQNPSLHLSILTLARGGTSIGSWLDSGNPAYEEYNKRAMALEPDYVFIEFGHNDGADTTVYQTRMQNLVDNYIIGISSATPVFLGCNPQANTTGKPVIGQFDDINVAIAQAATPDYAYSPLWHDLLSVWTNSANWTAIGGVDVIHPGTAGNIAMAYKSILGLGWTTSVSQAVINGGAPSVTSNANCTISSLTSNSYGGVDFSRLDTKLPWAIDEAGRANALTLYSGITGFQDFSTTVTGLAAGTYDIYIDGVLVSSQTNTALSSGWNMADLTSGPYFDQCQEILGRIRDLHDVNRSTLGANPTPREGMELYKSNASYAYYNLGYRGPAVITYCATALASIASYDALLHTAKQPVTRSFSLRRQGFGAASSLVPRINKLRRSSVVSGRGML